MMSQEEKVMLVIRVRGRVKVRPQIEDTLGKLRLGRLHQARILKVNSSLSGMIDKVKDYVTWGEVSQEVVEKMLAKRGRIPGNQKLTDAHVKKNSKQSSIKSLAKAIAAGDASVNDVEGLKPVFRLSPPSGGYRGKRTLSVGMGGITGYRGEDINTLAMKMI